MPNTAITAAILRRAADSFEKTQGAQMIKFEDLYRALHKQAVSLVDDSSETHIVVEHVLNRLRGACLTTRDNQRLVGGRRTTRDALTRWLLAKMPAEVTQALREAADTVAGGSGTCVEKDDDDLDVRQTACQRARCSLLTTAGVVSWPPPNEPFGFPTAGPPAASAYVCDDMGHQYDAMKWVREVTGHNGVFRAHPTHTPA